MRSTRVILAIVLIAAVLQLGGDSFGVAGRGDDAVIAERRLIVVGEGTLKRPIAAALGEVIQIRPFRFPAGPDFNDAELKVEIPYDKDRGARVLEYIGSSQGHSDLEGPRAAPSAFFLVVGRGQQAIHISVAGIDNERWGERYKRTYVVRSGE